MSLPSTFHRGTSWRCVHIGSVHVGGVHVVLAARGLNLADGTTSGYTTPPPNQEEDSLCPGRQLLMFGHKEAKSLMMIHL